MKSFSSEIESNHLVEVNWADRWQVYQRLKELDIPCSCTANQPLKVEIGSPMTAVQLWSVIRRLTASRQDQIWTLECCWKNRYQQF
ncbi:hypothetical protein LC653_00480 [Nostoc sp. CHAB 5784]|uniref:Uncharacterized protein n=3 Tax=Nostoc TaxID=1177 RepID=A0ABS8I7V9_9NOSO|nr:MULTISPECIES: Asr1405/Asl0597 family protein [Nostoc]MCC5599878.1 hypothetical protein [Nostoc favosum CHAB5714]MCC5662446.1 hypothetical protein [Nostoc mirabile CHAB5784]